MCLAQGQQRSDAGEALTRLWSDITWLTYEEADIISEHWCTSVEEITG